MNIDTLDDFTRAYIECALWSSIDDNDEGLDAEHDITDIAPETHAAMVEDCRKFQAEYADLLAIAYPLYTLPPDGETTPQAMAGHDFWLTRNGHGAGFWDRGLGDTGESLTAKCGWRNPFGEVTLYIGDDGKIYA